MFVCIKLLQEALCWPQCSVWGSTGRWGWQSRMALNSHGSAAGVVCTIQSCDWGEKNRRGVCGQKQGEVLWAPPWRQGELTRKVESHNGKRILWFPSHHKSLIIKLFTILLLPVLRKKKKSLKEGSKWERWWVPYLLSRPFPRSHKSSFSQVQWSLMLYTGTWGLCNMSGTFWQLCMLTVSPVILNQNIYFSSFYVKTTAGCWTI